MQTAFRCTMPLNKVHRHKVESNLIKSKKIHNFPSGKQLAQVQKYVLPPWEYLALLPIKHGLYNICTKHQWVHLLKAFLFSKSRLTR